MFEENSKNFNGFYSTQGESRRSVNPILHIWASKLSFFILLLKLKWVGFISHFMVLYFRNVDLDLPKYLNYFERPCSHGLAMKT